MPAMLVVGIGQELHPHFCHVDLSCTILSTALELAILPNQSLWQM